MKLKDVYISDIKGIPFYYSSLKNGISMVFNLVLCGFFCFVIYLERANTLGIVISVFLVMFFLMKSYFAFLRFKRKKPIFVLRKDELYCVDMNESFKILHSDFEIIEGRYGAWSSSFEVRDNYSNFLSMDCWRIKDVYELENRIRYYKLMHLKALREAKNQ